MLSERKFRVGETVKLITSMAPRGEYQVTQLLPHNGRHFEYRIKHATEPYERIAPEPFLAAMRP